jgi:exopolysaccharide biosynthesis polyprenyl glycosylphosphotransferase
MHNRSPLFIVLAKLLWGTTLATGVLAALMYAARVQTPPLPLLPFFWILGTAIVAVRILISRWMMNAPWRHRNEVLIVGTGAIARRKWREIRTLHHRSTNVVGFIDVNGPQSTYPEIESRYLGDVKCLEQILLKTVVDTVVIALPAKSCYDSIEQTIAVCDQVGVDVVFDTIFRTAKADEARLEVHPDQVVLPSHLFKRFLDLVLAVPAIILLSPLFFAISIAIRIDSPGNALFIQERFGYRRRRFKLYKFRTMVTDAEKLLVSLEKQNEVDGPIFKIRHDPRVTRIGKFLRKTSIDELPQLWNVVNGSMSLVGPRPMSVRDVSLFSESYLMRRFKVKPGITGLWQVSGRSNLSFDQWIAMDFRYIDNWSLKLDFSILLKTIPAVLKGSGAM